LVELKTEVHQLNRGVGSLEVTVEDIQDTVHGIEKAIDLDSVTIIEHGRRISVLEGVRG
jgi:hypothetical protein